MMIVVAPETFAVSVFLLLLVVHWVADFVLQTHWMATNKSKNNVALLSHVGVYTFMMFAATAPLLGWIYAAYFALVNGVAHFATDYVTSRITSKLYAKGDIHNFFVVVGLDQLIHQVTIAVILLWL